MNDSPKPKAFSNHATTRRQLLTRSAGICAAVGSGLTSPIQALSTNQISSTNLHAPTREPQRLETASGEWRFDQFFLPPETWNWRVIDAHDTGYIGSNLNPSKKPSHKRLKLDRSPDGKISIRHSVRKNEIVDPVGIDSEVLSADFSGFSRVLMRYHHWIADHSNLPGKWMGLQLGRGWAGKNFLRDSSDTFGRDGGSSTTMHPYRPKKGGNGIRLLSTHTKQESPYGELFGAGPTVLPLGRWLTVDIVIDKKSGHRLYVNGIIRAISQPVQPIKDWNSCRAIWYRTRLMHGGIPADLPALNNYEEWFGGFFVGVI